MQWSFKSIIVVGLLCVPRAGATEPPNHNPIHSPSTCGTFHDLRPWPSNHECCTSWEAVKRKDSSRSNLNILSKEKLEMWSELSLNI